MSLSALHRQSGPRGFEPTEAMLLCGWLRRHIDQMLGRQCTCGDGDGEAESTVPVPPALFCLDRPTRRTDVRRIDELGLTLWREVPRDDC